MLLIFYVSLHVCRPVRADGSIVVWLFLLSAKTDVSLFVVSSKIKLIPQVKLAILHLSALSVGLSQV